MEWSKDWKERKGKERMVFLPEAILILKQQIESVPLEFQWSFFAV